MAMSEGAKRFARRKMDEMPPELVFEEFTSMVTMPDLLPLHRLPATLEGAYE